MKLKLLVWFLVMAFGASLALAQDEPAVVDSLAIDTTQVIGPAPVSMLTGKDKPNDHGHAVVIGWETSPDDGAGQNSVMGYQILLSLNPEGPFDSVGFVPAGNVSFEHIGAKDKDAKNFVPDNTDLYYRVDAVSMGWTAVTPSAVLGPIQSCGQLFNRGRWAVLIAVLIFSFFTIFYVMKARGGAELYIRPIGGIEAVDDAIGRATEMGRPILYVLGLGSAADVATIASFTILGRVAKRVAEYQTALMVPTYDPIVMTVAQEVVKSAYMDAGRPEDYKEDCVHFVTQSQFAYVAAVNGLMLRERPATNVYMGKFYAESLLLAETGSMAGSIQISGTDEIAQIPFFIVACDYTLIGEELYAASAYLGREPKLLGSLKAQDWGKAIFVVLSIIGLIAAQLGWTSFVDLFRVVD
ncbi:MAG TPA: hypothetical protein PLF13_12110 [candidate division Zixibacteria bacterium]|nr:hypothetical protein [candidate division Zixibacteria bacterium]